MFWIRRNVRPLKVNMLVICDVSFHPLSLRHLLGRMMGRQWPEPSVEELGRGVAISAFGTPQIPKRFIRQQK